MPTDIDINVIADGELFSSTTLQSQFTGVGLGFNDLPSYSAAEHAFGRPHLPSLVVDDSNTSGGIFIEHAAVGSPPLVAANSYNNMRTGWGVDGDPVAITDGTTALTEVFTPAITLGFVTPEYITGILVMYDLHWLGVSGGSSLDNENVLLCTVIQWYNGASWISIDRTEKIWSPGTVDTITAGTGDVSVHEPVYGFAFITASDVSGDVERIRVAVMVEDNADAGTTHSVSLREGSFAAIPLHVGP